MYPSNPSLEAVPAAGPVMIPGSPQLLEELDRDLKRLKQQKARPTGGVEARVLTSLAFVDDEHYTGYKNKSLYTEPQDPNKLYLVFNLIKPRLGKLLGRLASIAPPFKARPDRKDPKAYADAEVVDRLLVALDEKLDQHSKTWEILWWMMVGGVAFEYTPWVPNASLEPQAQFGPNNEVLFKDLMTGDVIPESAMMQAVTSQSRAPESFEIYEEVQTVGDVGSEVLGPLNVFVDQSVKSIADLAPDQWVHIAKIRTMGWIEENFGKKVEPDKKVEIVSTQFQQNGEAVGGHFLKDLIPLVQGSCDEDDAPIAVVVESYQPASKKNPRGRYVCWVPGKQILHDQPNPYEEVPLTDFHWRPVTTTFWTSDYITSLIAPQRFLNKRLSQLGEQSNATLYSQILLGGALSEKDINSDSPGVVKGAVSDTGVPLVQRLGPPEIPSWYMNSIELVVKLFNDIAGGADLFQESKFPGQLRGPLAVPMLQEILDTEWGPLFNHIGQRMAKVKQLRLNRVKQFYEPIRTLHYTARNQKDEVLTFHTEKILKSGTNFNITVERGALLPELRALRESRVRERLASPLAVLYLDERTGRLDKSKIAEDLQFGDAGRESREAQYRKLSQEIVEMIWQAKGVPPVLPFYDHAVMMDELEAAMATTEFLRASPQVQTLFTQRWEQHRFYLAQEAAAQQQAMQSGMIQNAVAQATQQAAAQAAAEAVNSSMTQIRTQDGMGERGETRELVRSAVSRADQAGPPRRRVA